MKIDFCVPLGVGTIAAGVEAESGHSGRLAHFAEARHLGDVEVQCTQSVARRRAHRLQAPPELHVALAVRPENAKF